MKNMKKWFALGLALVMSLTTLAGCGGSEDTTAEGGDDTAAGSVYFLNFKPEQDQQWQDLAKVYTEETGVDVTVVTAASGEYETTLMSEMGKSGAPTLFQVNGPVGLANWKDYCLDLADTDIYSHLISDNYALKDGDTVYSIAYLIESYGIITNKTLLEKAGYTVEDIQSFEDLKAVAEDITARKDELGFAAFASTGMESSSDWRFKTHLANMPIYFEYQEDGISSTDAIKGTYLDNYRAIFDLYINNSTCEGTELAAKTGDDARNEFLAEEAVFFQNGSWEYANLVNDEAFAAEELTMIPIYVGLGDEANQGLCTGTENYWCVNNQADQADIDATIEFINWCVTSEEGTTAMADSMGFTIPFDTAKDTPNVFVLQDAANLEAGKTPVAWNFASMPSEEWKNGVGSALTAYAADQTPANWGSVVAAFVDGWATEYALANSQ